jgi:hypothetical protein
MILNGLLGHCLLKYKFVRICNSFGNYIMIHNGQLGHYLNLNKFVEVCSSFGNIIIINSSYYDDFTFYRFLFEFKSFLGSLWLFGKLIMMILVSIGSYSSLKAS